MMRYTLKYIKGEHYCRDCGAFTGEGIQTDRKTGEDYFVCKKHIKTGKCKRNDLHPDFRHLNKKTAFLNEGNKEKQGVLE